MWASLSKPVGMLVGPCDLTLNLTRLLSDIEDVVSLSSLVNDSDVGDSVLVGRFAFRCGTELWLAGEAASARCRLLAKRSDVCEGVLVCPALCNPLACWLEPVLSCLVGVSIVGVIFTELDPTLSNSCADSILSGPFRLDLADIVESL